MTTCPNTNSPEWKNLVETLNEDIAWDTYARTKGEIVTPMEGAMLTMIKDVPAQATALLEAYIPDSYKKTFKGTTTVLDLIRSSEGVYDDQTFKAWATQNDFAERLGLIPAQDKKLKISPTPIKKGVIELFESNPELANQVYEALGFNNDRTLDVRNNIIKAYKEKTTINLKTSLLQD